MFLVPKRESKKTVSSETHSVEESRKKVFKITFNQYRHHIKLNKFELFKSRYNFSY